MECARCAHPVTPVTVGWIHDQWWGLDQCPCIQADAECAPARPQGLMP